MEKIILNLFEVFCVIPIFFSFIYYFLVLKVADLKKLYQYLTWTGTLYFLANYTVILSLVYVTSEYEASYYSSWLVLNSLTTKQMVLVTSVVFILWPYFLFATPLYKKRLFDIFKTAACANMSAFFLCIIVTTNSVLINQLCILGILVAFWGFSRYSA